MWLIITFGTTWENWKKKKKKKKHTRQLDNSSTVRPSTVFLQWMKSFDVSGLCSDYIFARFSFQSVQTNEKNCPFTTLNNGSPIGSSVVFVVPGLKTTGLACSKTSKNRSHCMTTIILYKISILLYSPCSVACAVGLSVTTSLTEFSFQNLVSWSLFEFSATEIT